MRQFTHNARTAWTLVMLRWAMMHMCDGSNGRGHAGAGNGRGDAGEDYASERGADIPTATGMPCSKLSMLALQTG